MGRAKTKSVTMDGVKHCAEQGAVVTRACKDGNKDRDYHIKGLDKHDAISLELHFCTAFLSQNEAIQVIASMAKAGYRQWGDSFMDDVRGWIEAVDAQ